MNDEPHDEDNDLSEDDLEEVSGGKSEEIGNSGVRKDLDPNSDWEGAWID